MKPKPQTLFTQLSRRERQIMNAAFQLGEATAQEIMAALPDPPSYSAVRSALAILVDKGHLSYRKEGRRYIYAPAFTDTEAGASAAKHLLGTFFKGNVTRAVSALLRVSEDKLTEEDLDQLAELITKARKEGQ
jgi:predicted transcriptional regulator